MDNDCLCKRVYLQTLFFCWNAASLHTVTNCTADAPMPLRLGVRFRCSFEMMIMIICIKNKL
jgi:hypothetical protein